MIGQPTLMRELTRVGMHSRTLMDWVLRIMANLLREDELGPAEAVYRAVAQTGQGHPRALRRLTSPHLPTLGGSGSAPDLTPAQAETSHA